MLGMALSSDSWSTFVEEAKHTLSLSPPSTSGGCVSFNEPNSTDDDDRETLRAAMRRNMVAQLHRHLGPERVVDDLEKQVLLCEVEGGEDDILNL